MGYTESVFATKYKDSATDKFDIKLIMFTNHPTASEYNRDTVKAVGFKTTWEHIVPIVNSIVATCNRNINTILLLHSSVEFC